MTKAKFKDQNRRTHAAKVLVETTSKPKSVGAKGVDALNGQFRLIKQDILKLREDLVHGFDLVRELVETKISRRNLIKSK